MARRVKELMTAELEKRFRDIKETGCVLVNFEGLKADEARIVRASLREVGGEMMVVKNSLFAIALDRLGAAELYSLVRGPTAVIHAQNPVDAARAIKEAAAEYPAIELLGGYADGAVVDAGAVAKLAEIPDRETLLSMVAGALLAPLRRLAFGLTAKQRALLNGLDKLRERKKEEESE
jgi:large subunit ribosomal protein L10